MKYVPGSAYAIKLCHLEHQFCLVPLVVEVIYFSLFLLYFNLNILNPQMYGSFIVLNYLTAYFDRISFILLNFNIELQSDFQAHVAECKFKQVPCQQCGNLIEPQALQDHMSKECTKRKIACKHCQLEVVVENLEVCLYRGILVQDFCEESSL